MSLDRERAIELRDQKVPFREICRLLDVMPQNLTRFFNAVDHERWRGPTMPFVKKELEPEMDNELYHRKQEAIMAQELWFGAMRGCRWDVKRKDGEG